MAERFGIFAIYFYLCTVVIEAPLRYILSLIGCAALIYLREIVLALAATALLWSRRRERSTAILILFGGFFAAVGLFFTRNPVQVAMGIKTILPFIVGYLAAPRYCRNIDERERTYLWIFLICALGLILEGVFADLPWRTMHFEVAGVPVEKHVGFIATYHGVLMPRLSGFMRAHYAIAGFISYAVVWLYMTRQRSLFLLLAGFPFVVLTTSKVSIVIYIIVIALALWGWHRDKYSRCRVFRYVATGVTLLMVGLPLAALLFHVVGDAVAVSPTDFLASVQERIFLGWPKAFGMVADYGSIIFGRGVGGIGRPVVLFDMFVTTARPVDNFFVILYGIMGFFSAVFIFSLLYRLRSTELCNRQTELMLLLYIVFVGNGVMNDMLDQVSLFHFGFVVWYLFNRPEPDAADRIGDQGGSDAVSHNA